MNTSILILESSDINDIFDFLKWWKSNAMKYSTLACITFNIFSISSMSIELKWVFNEYLLIILIYVNLDAIWSLWIWETLKFTSVSIICQISKSLSFSLYSSDYEKIRNVEMKQCRFICIILHQKFMFCRKNHTSSLFYSRIILALFNEFT